RDRLQSVITARNSGGDETRRGRLKGDVADLETLNDLVRFAFVVEGDVVGRVELALRVVIEIDVNPVGDDAARFGGELKINQRLERAVTAGNRVEEKAGRATLALIFFAAELEAAVELKSDVGVLADDRHRLHRQRRLRLRRKLPGIRGRLLRSREVRRRNLPPNRFENRSHVLLKRCRS